jgi:thiamine biosynthesis lipoprotein
MRRVTNPPLALLVSLAAAAAAGCTRAPALESVSGLAQGTTYTLQWWSEQPVDPDAVAAAATAELDRIDALLSNYRTDSVLERFNAVRSVEPQSLPAELVALLRVAVDVHRASSRCFDPTVRPLVHLWGFDGDEPHVPDAASIAAALENVGLDKLEILDAQTVRKTVPGVEIDMSSIGQGYTVARLAAAVEGLGIADYLVEIGGELLARGHKPRGERWRVGIENPTAAGGAAEALVVPGDAPVAVVTSGTYRHYFEAQGRSYGHILDARTGRPVEHALVEVTVVGTDPTRAAAWGTALLCLGPEEGARTADREGLAATLAVRSVDSVIWSRSARFAAEWGGAAGR